MDIRISPSKLGNRYVLGRAGKEIRNITGSFRIDGFAKGIISKYEKAEDSDLPITQMELLKRPELPEALADIQEIINELLIINRSHTDVENKLFRKISIENNILKINMLLSRLEASNEYKTIRQGLENIYHTEMASIPQTEITEGSQLELPLNVLTEEQLVSQIETVLQQGGISSRELVDRIMGPAEREVRIQSEELIRQPEYIPMNTVPLSHWKSPEARNFFWRVQRLEKQDRELVLESLGGISLSRLETILAQMDTQTWLKYSVSIAEKIKLYMTSAESPRGESASRMAEPIPVENYYSQLLQIIGSTEELTPEILLEEKENLIRFLEREDTDTERIRTEVIRILEDIHRTSLFTPTVPEGHKGIKEDEKTGVQTREIKTVITEDISEAAEEQTRKTATVGDEQDIVRKRLISRVIGDIEEMDVAGFAVLYDRILENAQDMPQDIVEYLISARRTEGTEITEEELELDRQHVLNFLRKTQDSQGYYTDVLLRNIIRASEHREKSYQTASQIAETTMNLSVAEWQQFTTQLEQLSEKSELSRRYIEAVAQAQEAAEKAREEDSAITGADSSRQMTPEMREQVESTKEKMIFITQLDKAFKEGVDIYEEGDILTENSIFSQYVYKRDTVGENAEIPVAIKDSTDAMVEYPTRDNLRTLAETINTQPDKAFKEGVDIYEEGDILTENSIFSQYVYKRETVGENAEIPVAIKDSTRAMVEYLTRDNLRTLTEAINQRITERQEREEKIREEILLTQRQQQQRSTQIETLLEERELIHPQLRLRRIKSSMEPMLEEMSSDGVARAAVDQALNYIEKRRDARTGETIVVEELIPETPVELVTMRRAEPATREEIEEIRKTAEDTKRRLDENITDIQFVRGDTERTEVTNESIVDMKTLKEKLTVQASEIEKIRAIQEQLIRAGKSDSYYTQKTITKVNEQLRMERLRRGL